MPTVGPETYLEVLDSLLGRQGLAVTHCGGKDTESRGTKKILLILFFVLYCYVAVIIFLFICLF